MKKIAFYLAFFSLVFSAEILKLKNGLTVLIETRNIPAVSMCLFYRAGSFFDPKGYEGTSFLLNQLSYQGTRRTAPWEEILFLKRIGGQIDSELLPDFVIYQSVFPKEELPLVLWFEVERMKNLELNPNIILTNRAILASQVQQNFQMDLNFNIYSSIIKASFKNTPYSHPPTGYPETIAKIPHKVLQNFYRKYYNPANLTIVLVGPVTEKDKELIVKMFSPVKSKEAFVPHNITFMPEDNMVTIRTNLARKKGFVVAYRISPVDVKTRIAFELLKILLEKRIEKEMLQTGAISDYSVEIQHLTYASLFYVYFSSNGNLKKWIKFLDSQIKQVRSFDLKTSELRRLKESFSAELAQKKQNFDLWCKELGKLFLIWNTSEEKLTKVLVELSPIVFRGILRSNIYNFNRTRILIEPWR